MTLDPETLNPETLNKVTWKIPNALALVGSASGEEWNGMTASWITQLSMEPVLIGVGIDNKAVTHRLISEGGSFTVNLWSSDDTRPFVKFSKPAEREGSTLNGRPVTPGAVHNMPTLAGKPAMASSVPAPAASRAGMP